MDPITIGTIIAVGGSLFKGYSAYQQGQANEEMAKLQAALAETAATDAILRGEHEASLVRSQASALIAKQRVAYAAAGVDVDSGTASVVQQATAGLGELDALTIRNNAAREAWGYRVDAAVGKFQGRLDRQAGNMRAVGSILSAGVDYYTMRG